MTDNIKLPKMPEQTDLAHPSSERSVYGYTQDDMQAFANEAVRLNAAPSELRTCMAAVKTLLSRDPCMHANTAIQMIDAALAAAPEPQGVPRSDFDAKVQEIGRARALVQEVFDMLSADHPARTLIAEKTGRWLVAFEPQGVPEDDNSPSDLDHTPEGPGVDPFETAEPQGVAEPARPKWFNQCDRTVPEALRYLADHERPRGGEDRFNSAHLYQLADEIERTAAHPQQSGAAQPEEMSPDFTDTARAALLWVLWHHQGGSSDIGQPIRFALGMGQHERLNEHQVREAKRWGALNPKPTHEAAKPEHIAEPSKLVQEAHPEVPRDSAWQPADVSAGQERKPLSEDEIHKMDLGAERAENGWLGVVRTIEAAHGITRKESP